MFRASRILSPGRESQKRLLRVHHLLTDKDPLPSRANSPWLFSSSLSGVAPFSRSAGLVIDANELIQSGTEPEAVETVQGLLEKGAEIPPDPGPR